MNTLRFCAQSLMSSTREYEGRLRFGRKLSIGGPLKAKHEPIWIEVPSKRVDHSEGDAFP